jgi:hypothetical protein
MRLSVSRSSIAAVLIEYARICFGWPEEPPYQPLSNDVAEIEPEIINALNRIIDLPAEVEGVSSRHSDNRSIHK